MDFPFGMACYDLARLGVGCQDGRVSAAYEDGCTACEEQRRNVSSPLRPAHLTCPFNSCNRHFCSSVLPGSRPFALACHN
jgi:hypothetical protein